jgi:hypothetical protein
VSFTPRDEPRDWMTVKPLTHECGLFNGLDGLLAQTLDPTTILAGILLLHSSVVSVHAVGVWTDSALSRTRSAQRHGFRHSGMDAYSAFTHV